jgi:hypothetical protein
LFDNNPKKTLNKPNAEQILEFVDGIYMSTVEVGDEILHSINGISAEHREILALMKSDIKNYEILGVIQ